MNNDYVKLELANEIMNMMIGRYGRNGYDKSNEMLMTLLADREEMIKFNWKVIDKIISVYGPMVRVDKVESDKLSNCQIKPSGKACKNCQCQNQQELDK